MAFKWLGLHLKTEKDSKKDSKQGSKQDSKKSKREHQTQPLHATKAKSDERERLLEAQLEVLTKKNELIEGMLWMKDCVIELYRMSTEAYAATVAARDKEIERLNAQLAQSSDSGERNTEDL